MNTLEMFRDRLCVEIPITGQYGIWYVMNEHEQLTVNDFIVPHIANDRLFLS